MATKHLESEIERLKTERLNVIHHEEEIPEPPPPTKAVSDLGIVMLDFLQQNEDLRIEDSIPDLEAPRSDAVTENRELQHHVARALALLPTAWRTSFVLYHVERQSLAQIAEVNGITEGEAKRHLQSAREYLRQILLESGVRLRRAGGTESQTKVERKGAR